MRPFVIAILFGLAVLALAVGGYYYARQDSENRFAGCLRGGASTLYDIETKESIDVANKIKLCYVDRNIDWYDRHARRNLMLFRVLGAVVVVGSILIPVLNSIERLKKYVTVFSAIVAISASLSGFFGWRESWSTFRAAQFQLEYLENAWQLEMFEASQHEGQDASAIALAVTRKLIEDAYGVISKETGGFFERVPPLKQGAGS